MPGTMQTMYSQVTDALALLRDRRVQLCVGVALLVTILAGWLAPAARSSGWDWLRFSIILALSTVAVLVQLDAGAERHAPAGRQSRLLGVATFILLAIVLNATFGFVPTLVYSVSFSLVVLEAMRDRRGRAPWLMCLLLVMVIPSWVWTALDAWDPGLLLLLPIAALALLSDGHIRSAVANGDELAPGGLSMRGHRLGSWIGVLAVALLILVVGVLTSVSNTWVAFGAIGAIVLIALEGGLPASRSQPRRSTILVDLSLAWLALAWLISL